jgi:hypothetical protein
MLSDWRSVDRKNCFGTIFNSCQLFALPVEGTTIFIGACASGDKAQDVFSSA